MLAQSGLVTQIRALEEQIALLQSGKANDKNNEVNVDPSVLNAFDDAKNSKKNKNRRSCAKPYFRRWI